MAFKVEYPCLLSPLLAGGGGMATERDDDDDGRPNENDTLSLVLLLCMASEFEANEEGLHHNGDEARDGGRWTGRTKAENQNGGAEKKIKQ